MTVDGVASQVFIHRGVYVVLAAVYGDVDGGVVRKFSFSGVPLW